MSLDPDAPGSAPVTAVPVAAEMDPANPPREMITEPAKLLRIASMTRELLDETRQASVDERGRKRLAQIYHRAVGELSEVLSGDLKEELEGLAPPLEGVPTESEIRVAQAQLVGWLEGLFHGIQAAMFAQQASARQQFEELKRRGLPGSEPKPGTDGKVQPPGGQYL